MTPQRWQRVNELFEAACEVAPATRGEFLSTRCTGDDELRREVESLLEFDVHDAPTLQNPTLPSVAKLLDPVDERAQEAVEVIAAQRRLGAYELLRPLATGGMSMVWLAQRADDQFHQLVAVKVIKRGLEGPDVLTRFRNERQLLANLSHPNIARLLDGGVTDEGLPYLVMEYVDGKPIDKFCDERSLSLPRRLELFRTVCAAVAYAHQSLVVHRDLKPANTLVTPAGTPLLLDFGIAKVLNPTGRAGLDTITLLGERPMTPAYASPEQIRGRPVTTASDVYSLGVVLYELLTGHRPYESADGRPVDYERAVCDVTPARPSVAVLRGAMRSGSNGATAGETSPKELAARRDSDPARLAQRLAGDLDIIVLKAMEKDPGRRYASVEQFAEDVRRHLVGLPVRARPATLSYQARKFVLRNRWPLTAAAVVVAIVSTLVVMLWRESRVASRERDRALLAEKDAKESRDDAQQKADRLQNISELVLKLLAAAESSRDLFDETAHQYDVAPPEPKFEADLRITLGRGYVKLRVLERARDQFARAAALRRDVLGSASLETAAAYYELAAVCEPLGEWSDAEHALAAALEAQRLAIGSRHSATAAGVNALGELLLAMHRFDEAQRVVGELFLETPGLGSFDPGEVARGRLNYARILAYSDLPKATVSLDDLLSLERARIGERHRNVGSVLVHLAECRRQDGKIAVALELCEKGVEILRSDPLCEPRRLADGMTILGRVLHDASHVARAEDTNREALSLLAAAGFEHHPAAAEARAGLAEALAARGDFEGAIEHLREALSIRTRAVELRAPLRADAMQRLGVVLTRAGRYEEAEPMLHDALVIRRETQGAEQEVAMSLDALANLFELRGDKSSAAPVLRELVSLCAEWYGEKAAETVSARARLDKLLSGEP